MAMRFDLYRRYDLRMLVVPALLPSPALLGREGGLESLGRVELDFNALSAELGQDIALMGYGMATQDDELLIDAAEREAPTRVCKL